MNKKFLIIIASFVLLSLLFIGCKNNNNKKTQKPSGDVKSDISYVIGHSIGTNMKKSYVELDIGDFVTGLKEGLKGKKSKFSEEDINKIQVDFQKILDEKRKEAADKKVKENNEYMEKNKKNSGIITTGSGLQYKVITQGNGPIPKPQDTVKINYIGKLTDNTVFEDTYTTKSPVSLPVSGIIKGMEEALQLMNVGSKWEIFIPSELAYGPQEMSNIPANSILVFELELLSIEPPVK